MADGTTAAATTTTTEAGKTADAAATTILTAGDKAAEGSEAVTKAAEGEGASDKSKDGEADKAKEGAPEKYEFKFPEGVQADEVLLGEFTPLVKELNLNQDGAQKLVDLYVKTQNDAAKSATERWEALNSDWTAKTTSDKEFGGADLGKNMAVAKKAIDAFGTPELKEALNLTGVGNHPEFARFFYRVGKAMSDDKFDTGNGKTSAAKDPAKLMFPDQN